MNASELHAGMEVLVYPWKSGPRSSSSTSVAAKIVSLGVLSDETYWSKSKRKYEKRKGILVEYFDHEYFPIGNFKGQAVLFGFNIEGELSLFIERRKEQLEKVKQENIRKKEWAVRRTAILKRLNDLGIVEDAQNGRFKTDYFTLNDFYPNENSYSAGHGTMNLDQIEKLLGLIEPKVKKKAA